MDEETIRELAMTLPGVEEMMAATEACRQAYTDLERTHLDAVERCLGPHGDDCHIHSYYSDDDREERYAIAQRDYAACLARNPQLRFYSCIERKAKLHRHDPSACIAILHALHRRDIAEARRLAARTGVEFDSEGWPVA